MRTITSAALAKLAQATGTEPVIFVDIQWSIGGPYVRYSAAEFPGAIPTLERIADIDTGVNIQGSSFGVSCSVTLIDRSGDLKQIIDTHDIHKVPCRVYHWYPDLSIADAFVIFQGQISSPVIWSEGSRKLSFTILDQINSRDVGFSLEQGQFNYISDDIVGETWPICFGDVLHVPAVKAVDVLTATSTAIFGIPDPTLILKRFQIECDLANYFASYNYFNSLIYLLQSTITPGYVTKQSIKVDTTTPSSGVGTFTLSYKGVETAPIGIYLDADPIEKLIGQVSPDWTVVKTKLGKVVTLTLSFKYPSKYKTIQDALSALKPAVFTPKTMSGIPDTAITAKPLKMTVDGAEIDYTSYETMVYTRAKELQEEYVDAIIAEDALKQEIEDLSTDCDFVNKMYDEIVRASEKNGDADIVARLKAVKALKESYIAALLAKTQALTLASFNKEKVEVDAHNLKFVFESIKSLKQKILELFDAYVRLKKRYDTLLRIIEQQDEILVPGGKVQDSQQFTQDEPVDVLIKGVKIRGQFSDGYFTIRDAMPTYEDVIIADRQSEDLDYFWIEDSEVDLANKYCKIQNGRIILVTEQVGTRCKFELVKKKSNIRSSPDDFVFSGLNEGQIKATFGASLVGTETVAQLVAIANSIPKDISKDIYARLGGGEYVQVLKTFQPGKSQPDTPVSGSYQLRYNGQVTDLIDCNAKEDTIRDALVAGTALKAANIEVKCWNYPADGTDAVLYPSGTFSSGIDIEFRITFSNAATSTDPVPMYPIEVVTTRPVDALGADIGLRTATSAAKPTGDPVYVDTFIRSEGAHEFTAKQIVSKIENAVESSKHGKEFKSIQTAIENASDVLLSQMQQGASADEIKQTRDLISAQESRYIQLLGYVKVPEQVIADAYKLINSEEQKVLFALELLRYLAWRHSLVPITAYFPDPHLEYCVVGTDITKILAASPIILFPWLQPYKTGDRVTIMENMLTLPKSEAFMIQPGTEITSYGDYQQVYVANIVASTVMSVYAYKIVDGLQKLLPVPSGYYTKDESDDYGRFTLTSITLRKPLSEYREEHWIDGLYVSLRSSVGPNPMDVITWVLSNFTNLTLDSSTYTSLHAKLVNYPTHFALLQAKDALQLVKDIAYQARCACWLKQDVVHMVYLPEEGTSVYEFTEDNIIGDTLSCGYTDSDVIVTKYIANWGFDYSKGDKKLQHILRYNVKRFNENVEEHDYYTLTNRDLVQKTATFWLIRKSNIWKLATFKTPIDALNVEPFDTVTLNFDGNYFSTGSIKAVVQSANYNASDCSMTFSVWIPIRSGEMTKYIFAWPANLSASDIYPLANDIISGNAGDPFSDTVPNGISYDPAAVNPTNIRPKDYGDITPTDLTDTLPESVLGSVEEVTKLPPVPENFDPEIEDEPLANAQAVEVAGGAGGDVGIAKKMIQDDAVLDGAMRIVKVIRKNPLKTVAKTIASLTPLSGDPIDDLLTDIEVIIPWYDVVDSQGRTFPVEMSCVDNEDWIPAGTRITAVYLAAKGVWEGYIPTYINDSDTIVDAMSDV